MGTITEIYDYLRLLYARIGVPHCHICRREISSQSVDQIIDSISEFPEGTKIIVNAPVVKAKRVTSKLFESLTKQDTRELLPITYNMILNEDKIELIRIKT